MDSRIRSDRVRTSLLYEFEYRLIEQLYPRIPAWVTPNMLTAFGFLGALIVFFGLWISIYFKGFLLLSIIGLAIHWFGDSLDGRLAYYRNTPRKWYGWALDINTDWTAACIIGLGFHFYLDEFKIVSFVFVVAYGGSIIVSLLRYKINNEYKIDTFFLGPTELRIFLAIVILIEIFRDDTLLVFGFIGSLILIALNLLESYRVLRFADKRDQDEKTAKQALVKEKPSLHSPSPDGDDDIATGV